MKTLKITVRIDDKIEHEELKQLLHEVNIDLVDEDAEQNNNDKSLLEILKELRKINGPISKIEDPVAWQREQREDRKLPFRED